MRNSNELPSYVADTHAVIWHMMDSARLSTEARRRFQEADRGDAIIYVSVMTPIEMTYLFEKGKIPETVPLQFHATVEDTGKDSYRISEISYELTKIFREVPASLIPELPDRIIAATAHHLNLPLITKDRRIHDWKGITSVW
ncbi:MAG TPA: type II toxin-antitoxin system VapC family toxin [bacterium]|nr:type II toxin-antitoxin system VapC family toxin [bacterium]